MEGIGLRFAWSKTDFRCRDNHQPRLRVPHTPPPIPRRRFATAGRIDIMKMMLDRNDPDPSA